MSGYPGGHHDHFDNGYGQQTGGNTESCYQDDQDYGYGGYESHGTHGAQVGNADDGYYDELGYYNADPNNPYHQDGGYYDSHDQYQNDFFNGNGGYYDQAYNNGYPGHGARHGSEEGSEVFSDFTMRSDMALSPRTMVVYSEGFLSVHGHAGYGFVIHRNGTTVSSG